MTFCICALPAKRSTKSSAIVFDRPPSRFAKVASKIFQSPKMASGSPTGVPALDLTTQHSGKRLMQSRWSKLIPLAGALALMTANASAQTLPPINLLQGEQKPPLTPEEQERQKKLDDAYKSATKKIPEQTGQNDPWATVRPTAPDPSPKKKKQ